MVVPKTDSPKPHPTQIKICVKQNVHRLPFGLGGDTFFEIIPKRLIPH